MNIRLYVLYFAFSISALLMGCLPASEPDEGSVESPIDSTPVNPSPDNPINPDTGYMSKVLTDYILSGTDSQSCAEGSIVLKKTDSTEQNFSKIQDAIVAANEGDKVLVGKGEFFEVLKIMNKNGVVIKSDCKPMIQGIELKKSSNISISGMRINGANSDSHGIFLAGGDDSNEGISFDKLEVSEVVYGSAAVIIGSRNSNINIKTSYFHDNEKSTIKILNKAGPVEIKDSFISSNKRNGLEIYHDVAVKLINNTIVDSGTKRSWCLNGYGIVRKGRKRSNPEDVLLINNRIIANNGKKWFHSTRDVMIYKALFDSLDTGNVTSTGDEGDNVGIYSDIIAPVVLVGIEDNLSTSNPILRIPILVQDYSLVSTKVILNGKEVAFSPRYSFEPRITLLPGINNITVYSVDKSGNKSEDVKRVVTFNGDASAPIVRCNDNEIYKIDLDGNEENFTSIQAAILASQKGDKIFVGKVDSSESLQVAAKSEISLTSQCRAKIKSLEIVDSNKINIKGFIVDPGFSSPGITINGKLDFITIRDNEIRNAESFGLDVKSGNMNNRIVNNYFHHNKKHGMRVLKGGPFTVENNIFIKNGNDGMEIHPSARIELINNKIFANSDLGKGGYGIGMLGSWGWAQRESIKLTNNTIYGNNGSCKSKGHFWKFWKHFKKWKHGGWWNKWKKNRCRYHGYKVSSVDIERYKFIFDDTDTGNFTTTGVESSNTMVLSDSDAPVITFGNESGGATKYSTYALPISISDSSSTESIIKLNGQVVDEFNFISYVSILSLSEGVNTVEVTSKDYFDNSSTATFTVNIDATGPQLVTLSPADGSSVYSNDKNISVSLEANESLLSASVNGVMLNVSGLFANGSFVVPDFGANNLEFVMTDFAGNSSIVNTSITVTNDTDPPVVNIDLADNLITKDTQVPFLVSITDQSSVTTEVNLNGNVILESSDLNINSVLSPALGLNTLEITSVDISGNSTTLTRQITFDNVIPIISSVVPSEGSILETRRPSIIISYEDPVTGVNENAVSILINGADKTSEFTISQTGAVSALTSDLDVGLNSIIISVADVAGNIASYERKVDLGITSPELSITPGDGEVVDQQQISIALNYSGYSIDTNSVFLSINGQDQSSSLVVAATNAALLVSPTLNPGLNQIVGRVSNTFGLTTEVNTSVIFQAPTMVQTPPDVSDPPPTINQGSVNLNDSIIVAIDDPTSPIFGAMTLIPRAAVSEDNLVVNIELGSADDIVDPEPEAPIVGEFGPVLTFTSSAPFNSNVIVGIPFDRDAIKSDDVAEDEIVIVRYRDDGTFEIIKPYLVDMEKGLAFASTSGFSSYYVGKSCFLGCRRRRPSRYYMRTEYESPSSCVDTLGDGRQCDFTEDVSGNYFIRGIISSNLLSTNDPVIDCYDCPPGTTTEIIDRTNTSKYYWIRFNVSNASLEDVRYQVSVGSRRVIRKVVARIVPPIPPQPTDPPPPISCGQSGVMCNFLGNNTVGQSPDGSNAQTSAISVGESYFQIKDFEIDPDGNFIWMEPVGNATPPNGFLALSLRRVNSSGNMETIRNFGVFSSTGQPITEEYVQDLEYSILRNNNVLYLPLVGNEPQPDGSEERALALWQFVEGQNPRRIFTRGGEYFKHFTGGPNDSIFYVAGTNDFLTGNLIRFDTIPGEREVAITPTRLASAADKISPDGTLVADYEVDHIGDIKYFNNELYVIQKNANCIRKFDDQWVLHTVAGVCDIVIAPEGEDVDAKSARLGRLTTMEIDIYGNIFFYEDFPIQRYRIIRSDNGTVQTVVGGGTTPLEFNDFPISAKEVQIPNMPGFPDLGPFTVDDDGNLFALGGNYVYKVNDVLTDFLVPREPTSDPTAVPSTSITLTPVEINTENVTEMLKNSQHNDGYWDFEESYLDEDLENDSIRRLLATENALDFLLENGIEDEEMINDALLWVANQDYESTATVAKQMSILGKFKDKFNLAANVRKRMSSLLDSLISSFRPDLFGWGSNQYNVTNNLDTALAIEALSINGKQFDPDLGVNLVLSDYIDTVRVTTGNQYNRDIARIYFGGFGFFGIENPPTILNTLSMVRGLLEYREIAYNDTRIVTNLKRSDYFTLRNLVIPPVVNNAADYIIGSQRTNGSYGSVRETAETLKIIKRMLESGLITDSKLSRLQLSFDAAIAHLNGINLSLFELGSVAQFTDHFVSKDINVSQEVEPQEEIDVNSLPSPELGDGSDGKLFASGHFNINENSSNGRSRPDGVSLLVNSFVAQNIVEVIQAQKGDFEIGDEIAFISYQGAISPGEIQFNKIQNVDYSVTPARLTFENDLSSGFSINDHLVVQRVPQYSSIDSPSNLVITANRWDGLKGGAVFFRVAGAISNKVAIDVSGLGFRGGMSMAEMSQFNSAQGEGVLQEGQRSPSSLGANGCGGGNAVANIQSGGGGSYATSGSTFDSYTYLANSGSTFGVSDLSKVYLGCGGGSGIASTVNGKSSAGGAGGGIIYIFANEMDLNGASSYLAANGKSGKDGVGSGGPEFGSGGGSGGSIFLNVVNAQISSGSIVATGGLGSVGQSNQAGHAGGDGRVRVNYRTVNSQVYPSLGQGDGTFTLSVPNSHGGGL